MLARVNFVIAVAALLLAGIAYQNKTGRFQPVAGKAGGALDTKTGKVCFTFPKSSQNNQSGIPFCEDLR